MRSSIKELVQSGKCPEEKSNVDQSMSAIQSFNHLVFACLSCSTWHEGGSERLTITGDSTWNYHFLGLCPKVELSLWYSKKHMKYRGSVTVCAYRSCWVKFNFFQLTPDCLIWHLQLKNKIISTFCCHQIASYDICNWQLWLFQLPSYHFQWTRLSMKNFNESRYLTSPSKPAQ